MFGHNESEELNTSTAPGLLGLDRGGGDASSLELVWWSEENPFHENIQSVFSPFIYLQHDVPQK